MYRIGKPHGRGGNGDSNRAHLPGRPRFRFAFLERRQLHAETLPIQEVDQRRPDRKQCEIRHAHKEQPLAPVNAADQRRRDHGRDPAGQQDRGSEPVDRVERHHDRAGEGRALRHLRELERVFVDEHENARPRRRRRENDREQREGEEQLQIQRAGVSARAPQEKSRDALREAASRYGKADGEHTDQEVGDRIREAHERLGNAGHSARQHERRDQDETRDACRHNLRAPQSDDEDRDGDHALSCLGQAGGSRCCDDRPADRDQRRDDPDRTVRRWIALIGHASST